MINRLEDDQEVYKSTIYTVYLDGKTEGELGERLSIARNLLQMGMPAEQVAVATKFSADEVRKLIQ